MKKILNKTTDIFRTIFGYGIMITLFVGGATFFGYVAALIIGGETAAAICAFIYKKLVTVMIKATTSLVLLGLVTMYLSGEMALTAAKKNKN